MVTTRSDTPALPVRPMREDPIGYPIAPPAAVSADAQHLLRFALSKQKLDRDVFDRKQLRGYVTPAEANAFEPTERMLAAIAELEAVGLAEYNPEYGSLYATHVHPAYTVAYGRGALLIRVRVDDDRHPGNPALLAVLVGADIQTKDGRPESPEILIRSRHENATDFEHDTATTAYLTVRNPGPIRFSDNGRVTFTGTLTQADIYPLGFDPLTASDADNPAGRTCTSTHCERPHPLLPMTPPALPGLTTPQFVTIETLPYRPWLVADLAADIPAPTAEEPTE